jgi:hypothetical protein
MPKIEIELTEDQVRNISTWSFERFNVEIPEYIDACKDWVKANPPPHEWKVGDWAFCEEDGICFKVVNVDQADISNKDYTIIYGKIDCVPCKAPEVI